MELMKKKKKTAPRSKQRSISGYEGLDYREFMEKFRVDLATFLKYAEEGSLVPYSGLKARKQSQRLGTLLLMFRKISCEQDRRNRTIVKEVKKEIKNLDVRGR